MHSCIFYHRSTRPRKVCIFVLHLQARPLLGLVGKADYPPIKFTPAFWRGWHFSIFCLLQVLLKQHLGYLLVLNYQPCLLWTVSWGLLSLLEDLLIAQCSRHFRRELQSCCWFFKEFLRNLDCFYHPIFSGVSALVAGLSTVLPLVWRRFCGIFFVHQFPVMTGDLRLSARTALQPQATS